jgi:hypothetical protein
MNNDQVKAALLKLKDDVPDFTVILSGKKSDKVHGLYKPLDRSIILHNKNFASDNELMYTAIHEFAHHIQFTETAKPVYARVHTARFYSLFHELLYLAEEKGIHENIFATDKEFVKITETIKTRFMAPHGELIQAFGEALLAAHELCDKRGADFGDYVDRVLKLKRSNALSLIKLSNLNLDPAVGYENMKTLARIADPAERKRALKDLSGDYSPSMLELKYAGRKEPEDPVAALELEKKRLQKTIETLKEKLKLVEEKLRQAEEQPEPDSPGSRGSSSGDGLLKRHQP